MTKMIELVLVGLCLVYCTRNLHCYPFDAVLYILRHSNEIPGNLNFEPNLNNP